MTATVHQFSDLVQRKEIQRLEAAVRANNIPRIGVLSAPVNPSAAPDTRPWNIESSYYGSLHSQVRSQFDGLKAIKSPPVSGWGRKLLSILGWAGLLIAIAICFVR